MSNQDPIYDISEYSEKELYDILDLVNPSDRELEAKILLKIREYSSSDGKNNEMVEFLNKVYSHFFEEEEEEEGDEEYEEEEGVEGFTSGPNPSTTPTPSATARSNSTANPSATLASTQASALQVTTITNPRGTVNPQPGGGKETIQRTIILNSAERGGGDGTIYPNSGYYTCILDTTLKNVVALKYFSISIPYSWYNVNKNYGANVIYFSGISPGITNVTYKIQIPPGQYVLDEKNTEYDIINAVHNGVINMKNTNTDVNFGTTDISLNYNPTPADPSAKPKNKRATFIIDIQNIYDGSNYYISFPTTTIPTYLSLTNNSSPTSIFSFTVPADPTGITPIYDIYFNDISPYSKNSYFTIYNYQDNSNTGFSGNINDVSSNITLGSTLITVSSTENIMVGGGVIGTGIEQGTTIVSIDKNTNTVTISKAAVTTAIVSLSYLSTNIKDIITINLNSKGENTNAVVHLARTDIINNLNGVLQSNTYLTSASSISFINQIFQLNIVLNRKTTTQLPNMKQYISFPSETGITNSIWSGTTSCFCFNTSRTEVNDIYSISSPASIYYTISSSPTINLTCTYDPTYSYSSLSLTPPINPSNGYTKQEYLNAIQTTLQAIPIVKFISVKEDLSLARLVIQIEIYIVTGSGITLSELDYIIEFNDTISPTSWTTNLGLNASYIMIDYPQNIEHSYGQIVATDPILDAEITLTNSNNKFSILQKTTSESYTDTGLNDIHIIIPEGTYTKATLYQAINTEFNQNIISATSTLQSVWSTDAQTENVKLRLNINKIYRAQDYSLLFHDDTLFLSSVTDLNGQNVLSPLPWVKTLGWLLGFHKYQKYYLVSDPTINPNICNYQTYNNYTLDPVTNIINLTGDVKVDVDVIKNLYIVIDDHIQNQMDDGLVVMEPKNTNLSLPSYSSTSMLRTDPITNKLMVNLYSASNPGYLLTVKQLYAAQVQIPTQTSPNEKPYTPFTGGFSIVSLKYPLTSSYTDNGGSNLQQNRLYPGTVNIKKLTIKVVDDYGHIVDLNGDDWTLTLLVDIKYDKNRS